MRETVAGLRARTGIGYAPAPGLPGRPLGDDEPCPTLQRWPGAGALLEALTRTLDRLGPPESDTLWLCADARGPAPGGAAHFGALVVLEPLRLGPVVAGAGIFVAGNARVDPEAVVWTPAAGLAADWDAVGTIAAARALLGPAYDDERSRAVDALAAYLEELDLLARAGAPTPGRPWCELDDATRARVLAEHGVTGRWT
jgi:hypothetical protein